MRAPRARAPRSPRRSTRARWPSGNRSTTRRARSASRRRLRGARSSSSVARASGSRGAALPPSTSSSARARPSNDDARARAHPVERDREARHRGEVPRPRALAPVLRERDVRVRERDTAAHGDEAPLAAEKRHRARRRSWRASATKPSKPVASSGEDPLGRGACVGERDDAPAAARARELGAERARSARAIAHALDLLRREQEAREEHLVHVEQLAERRRVARLDREPRVAHDGARCRRTSSARCPAGAAAGARRTRPSSACSTPCPVWPTASTSGARERERLDGRLPLRRTEHDRAAERRDRRVDARRVAVEDALPGHRVLARFVVGRTCRTTARAIATPSAAEHPSPAPAGRFASASTENAQPARPPTRAARANAAARGSLPSPATTRTRPRRARAGRLALARGLLDGARDRAAIDADARSQARRTRRRARRRGSPCRGMSASRHHVSARAPQRVDRRRTEALLPSVVSGEARRAARAPRRAAPRCALRRAPSRRCRPCASRARRLPRRARRRRRARAGAGGRAARSSSSSATSAVCLPLAQIAARRLPRARRIAEASRADRRGAGRRRRRDRSPRAAPRATLASAPARIAPEHDRRPRRVAARLQAVHRLDRARVVAAPRTSSTWPDDDVALHARRTRAPRRAARRGGHVEREDLERERRPKSPARMAHASPGLRRAEALAERARAPTARRDGSRRRPSNRRGRAGRPGAPRARRRRRDGAPSALRRRTRSYAAARSDAREGACRRASPASKSAVDHRAHVGARGRRPARSARREAPRGARRRRP